VQVNDDGYRYYFVFKTWLEIKEIERSKGLLIDDEKLIAQNNNNLMLGYDESGSPCITSDQAKASLSICEY
jgi:hypothetical protein